MTSASLRSKLTSGAAAGVLVVAGILGAGVLAQEKYPSRPVDFIVPFGPGGGADQLARKAGKLMEEDLKVSFPVLNVPGASGNTGIAKLLAGRPDGHAIGILSWDTFAGVATGGTKWTLKDIVPVAMMIIQDSGFFVADNSRFKTWADVEAEAKAKPGSIKVAVTGFQSPDELTINYLASKGIKLLMVPFAKPSERYVSILGAHAELLYEQAGDVKSFLDGKQMRPVIFFAEKRSPEFKDIPVSKELGYDVTLTQRRAVIVKAGTEPQKIKVLSDSLAKVAANPEYKAYLKEQYADPNSFQPTQEALAIMERDLNEMKKLAALTAGQTATGQK
jgi:tripartite-type tricarboxylate transporter receptor subunit TctC